MLWILLLVILTLWLAFFGFHVGGLITLGLLIAIWGFLLISLQLGRAQ